MFIFFILSLDKVEIKLSTILEEFEIIYIFFLVCGCCFWLSEKFFILEIKLEIRIYFFGLFLSCNVIWFCDSFVGLLSFVRCFFMRFSDSMFLEVFLGYLVNVIFKGKRNIEIKINVFYNIKEIFGFVIYWN